MTAATLARRIEKLRVLATAPSATAAERAVARVKLEAYQQRAAAQAVADMHAWAEHLRAQGITVIVDGHAGTRP